MPPGWVWKAWYSTAILSTIANRCSPGCGRNGSISSCWPDSWWLVPDYLIAAYPDRIVNIHPALLPKYGGKGMYGDRVHQAVVEAGEKESGITIHRVNGQYDSGDIIAQHRVPLAPDDTPQEVAAKVHALEYEYYPQAVEAELAKL